MNMREDHREYENVLHSSLRRCPNTLNLAGLRRQRLNGRTSQSRQSKSKSCARSSCSQAGSENSEAMYIATPRKSQGPRQARRSLSAVSNGSVRRFDGSEDKEEIASDPDEELSWNIIDREIFEWQYVCQVRLLFLCHASLGTSARP